MPHSRSAEGIAAQKRRDLRRRRYMRSVLPILRTQRDTAEQALARHITVAGAQAEAALERHEEARRVIVYIEAQLATARAEATRLEQQLQQAHAACAAAQHEASRERDEFALLRTESRIQRTRMEREHEALRGEQADLVAACDDLLAGSAAAWGPAHYHLRDTLARHRWPVRNPPPEET